MQKGVKVDICANQTPTGKSSISHQYHFKLEIYACAPYPTVSRPVIQDGCRLPNYLFLRSNVWVRSFWVHVSTHAIVGCRVGDKTEMVDPSFSTMVMLHNHSHWRRTVEQGLPGTQQLPHAVPRLRATSFQFLDTAENMGSLVYQPRMIVIFSSNSSSISNLAILL